jgi:hypothetical protein
LGSCAIEASYGKLGSPRVGDAKGSAGMTKVDSPSVFGVAAASVGVIGFYA